MTVAVLLGVAAKKIPRLDAEVLLAYILGCERSSLLTNSRRELSSSEESNFENLVTQRITGRPVAYLTGKKEFYGLEFFINESVLIPRPETELIVEEVLNQQSAISNQQSNLSLLDVGTGSGCIPIAIKKNWSDLKISACDISTEALEVAQKNAKRHDVKLQLDKSNLLANISGEFQIVTANLPYIGTEVNAEVDLAVKKFEPGLALFAGRNGLGLYRRFLKQLSSWKKPPLLILFEIAPNQVRELKKLTAQYFPDYKTKVRKDLAGRDRMFKMARVVVSS